MQKVLILQMAEATAQLVSRHFIARFVYPLSGMPGPLQSLLDDGWQIMTMADPQPDGRLRSPYLLGLWCIVVCEKPDTPPLA